MGGEFPGDRGLTGENKGLILIYFKLIFFIKNYEIYYNNHNELNIFKSKFKIF